MGNEKKVELNEELLDEVVGGVYTRQEWAAMSAEERAAAAADSDAKRIANEYCKMD